MNLDRAGAIALIVGSIAYITLMAVHPSHAGPPVIGRLSLSALVHGTALVTAPVFGFGYAALAARLGLTRPLPALGLSFALFGLVFGMAAGTMSGLVIPEIIEASHMGVRGHGGAPVDPEALRQRLQSLANYTVWLNRAFAHVHYAMFSIAMILWSIAWTSRSISGWIVRVLGALVGIAVLAWQLSGTSNLDAQHGALVVTLGQALWTIMAASLLLLPREQ
ncbi:MAG: hypothetical protein ACT4OF_06725 [Caulobacteraceae bacterium]